MQSTNAKRAGGVIAASETADVLLVPNDSPGGGNFYAGWHQSVKTKANSLPKDVALYLSCLDTNVRYNAPLPDRASIVAKNTRPAVPAGPNDVHPRKWLFIFFAEVDFCSFWYFSMDPWWISKSSQDTFSAVTIDQYWHCGPEYTSVDEWKHYFHNELVGNDDFFCLCYPTWT